MPQVQDRLLDLLICSPAWYHCAMAAPWYINTPDEYFKTYINYIFSLSCLSDLFSISPCSTNREALQLLTMSTDHKQKVRATNYTRPDLHRKQEKCCGENLHDQVFSFSSLNKVINFFFCSGLFIWRQNLGRKWKSSQIKIKKGHDQQTQSFKFKNKASRVWHSSFTFLVHGCLGTHHVK